MNAHNPEESRQWRNREEEKEGGKVDRGEPQGTGVLTPSDMLSLEDWESCRQRRSLLCLSWPLKAASFLGEAWRSSVIVSEQ